MKKSTVLFAGFAAGAALLLSAAGASAATISFYDTGTPNPTDVLNTTGGLTGGDTQVSAGAFTDSGVFVVDAGTLLTSYDITTQHSGSLYTISGGTMEIYEGGIALPQTLVTIPFSSGTSYASTGSNEFSLGAGTYTIVINSVGKTPVHAGDFSTYSIEVQGSPTPEPATWAMMLVGFGGLGAMMRRVRSQAALTV